MGRGIVDPLDLHHVANPPSHPELLQLLGDELVNHDFDIRWLLREIALSNTYQRSSQWMLDAGSIAEPPAPETYQRANEKHLSAEQICWSVIVATGGTQLDISSQVASASVPPASSTAAPNPSGDDSSNEGKSSHPDLERLRVAYVNAFANPPQEPEVQFNPSLKAALFLMNDASVLDRLQPSDGNLIARLNAMYGPDEIAKEMYASILSREASADEVATIAQYMERHNDDRLSALADLTWALLASTEFCVNH